jgi:hypothetical protein
MSNKFKTIVFTATSDVLNEAVQRILFGFGYGHWSSPSLKEPRHLNFNVIHCSPDNKTFYCSSIVDTALKDCVKVTSITELVNAIKNPQPVVEKHELHYSGWNLDSTGRFTTDEGDVLTKTELVNMLNALRVAAKKFGLEKELFPELVRNEPELRVGQKIKFFYGATANNSARERVIVFNKFTDKMVTGHEFDEKLSKNQYRTFLLSKIIGPIRFVVE